MIKRINCRLPVLVTAADGLLGLLLLLSHLKIPDMHLQLLFQYLLGAELWRDMKRQKRWQCHARERGYPVID
jgi:hypothetical protein